MSPMAMIRSDMVDAAEAGSAWPMMLRFGGGDPLKPHRAAAMQTSRARLRSQYHP